VKISKTVDYYSTNPNPAITNADVKVNGITFKHISDGTYKPDTPFIGTVNQIYQLVINYDGKTYNSTAKLEPMFRVDTLFQTFRQQEGFIKAGYSINYIGFDDRPRIKYTYFRLGYFDTIVRRDSFSDNKILFNSGQTPVGVPYPFELPFTRFQPGDECVMIFRSVEKVMSDFIAVYNQQTTGAPGPFQTPPANLPTNIVGENVMGYFATYDVVRRRYKVK
jgi:hypothetical protein